MRTLVTAAALCVVASSAAAHDFWLQPLQWQAIPGRPMPFTVEVGHGASRERWAADARRLLTLTERASGGSVNIRPLFKAGGKTPHFTRVFRRKGLHILSLTSTNAFSDLPAIGFNEYIKEEGLTPAIDARARAGTTDRNGREYYSRRAKTLIQVGRPRPGDDAIATKPIGLTLEIVPLKNPYALNSDHILPVQVLYEGRPLPGALVKLTNLEFDARPLRTARTDATGRASFAVPQAGSWLVNVIWTKPIASREAEFLTTFSSLTFGYPAKRAP